MNYKEAALNHYKERNKNRVIWSITQSTCFLTLMTNEEYKIGVINGSYYLDLSFLLKSLYDEKYLEFFISVIDKILEESQKEIN